MPMTVNRETLLTQLECLQAGLSNKEIIEQSNCFVFKDGNAYTYNEEVFCSAPSQLDKDFAGAVRAEPLLAVLHRLPEEEIQIEAGENEIRLFGKRRRAGVRMEAEILLPVDSVKRPKEWKKLPDGFGEAVGVVYKCASTDQTDSKQNLVYVHVHPKWMEACDRFQFCRWRIKTPLDRPILVRRSSIKHIAPLGMTEFSVDDTWIHFRNKTGLLVSCHCYLDDYPDLSSILGEEGTPIVLHKGLVQAIEKAQIFSSEDAENNHVFVDVKPGKVRVKGQGTNGWYSESKKVKYSGQPISFFVSPSLLMELVDRHTTFEISASQLKADGGSFKVALNLGQEEKKEDKEKEEDSE